MKHVWHIFLICGAICLVAGLLLMGNLTGLGLILFLLGIAGMLIGAVALMGVGGNIKSRFFDTEIHKASNKPTDKGYVPEADTPIT